MSLTEQQKIDRALLLKSQTYPVNGLLLQRMLDVLVTKGTYAEVSGLVEELRSIKPVTQASDAPSETQEESEDS